MLRLQVGHTGIICSTQAALWGRGQTRPVLVCVPSSPTPHPMVGGKHPFFLLHHFHPALRRNYSTLSTGNNGWNDL